MVVLEHRHQDSTHQYVADRLPHVTSLLQGPNTSPEQCRAVLTFLRVSVAVLQTDILTPILPQITSTFCSGLGQHKQKFLQRSRGLMRKLIQRVGEENLRPYIPTTDVPLLEYLLKQNRRQDRKKDSTRKTGTYGYSDRNDDARLLASDDEGGDSDADDVENLVDVGKSGSLGNNHNNHTTSAGMGKSKSRSMSRSMSISMSISMSMSRSGSMSRSMSMSKIDV